MDIVSLHDNPLAEVLSRYDTPAYVRRGLQLAEARDRIYQCCQLTRDEYLQGVRFQLQSLRHATGDWNQLRNYLATERDCQILSELEAALLGREPARLTLHSGSATVGRSSWKRLPTPFSVPRARLRALAASIQRFNRRWSHFLVTIDLADVNRQVDAYNRYYLLEKECAMRSSRLAARGFIPARPVTHDELADRFPPLTVPRLRS